MPSYQSTDWLALKSRVDTMTVNPAMTVFDPLATVTPPSDATGPVPYILLSDIRNDPARVGIDPKLHIRSGTLLIAVQWPIARTIDHTQLTEIQGAIAAHFSADQCMTYGQSRLKVTQDASVIQPFVEGADRVAVIRVAWSSL